MQSWSYNSSVIETGDNPVLTISTEFSGYTGNVVVAGSTTPTGNWYQIENTTYANATFTDGYVIQGFHPYVQLQFTSTGGSIGNIYAR